MFPTTLIIGLGGVGSRITMGIYEKFMSRKPEDDDIDNFIALCFDTDAGDIKSYLEVLPPDCVVQTSSSESITVGQYVDRIKDITDVEEWFDTSSEVIRKMKLNEGAGQVRMASRLAYMSAMSEEKMNVIENSIKKLLKTDPARHQGNEIKIHIVCSLAGGTGAGSFLQTAYLVKDLMRSFNVNAPKITGYFVLGDVLCHDQVANLNEKQRENTRSNTYACMKELSAFINRKESQLIKNLELEYKIGQEERGLPTCDPYDHCYMIDFTNTDGTNIGDMQVYYDQVKDFMYMNAFSPMGDQQRSLMINNVIQEIQTKGKGRFAAIGVSKLVFPVDDLYEYFAVQRLVDNLSATWIKIDNDFNDKYEQYKKDKREGITTMDEPNRGDDFMMNVETIAKHGTGMERTEFKAVYDSTQKILDGVEVGSKSDAYLEAVRTYVESVIDDNKTFKAQKDSVESPKTFGEDDEKDADIAFINRREEALKAFKDFAFPLMGSVLRGIIRECIFIDANTSERVAKSLPEHHLNSWLLPKGNELHPLAVRYFLYNLRNGINSRLYGEQGKGGLEEENKALLKTIEKYVSKFDEKDDKLSPDGHVESPAETIAIKYGQKNLFNNKVVVEFKDTYLRDSVKHRNNIEKYTKDKLYEDVLKGLLTQVQQLIEESENFFFRLPDTLRGLQGRIEELLDKHEGKTDPSVMYVLAKRKMKELLYKKEIQAGDSLLFPTDISARIYRSMFDNAKLTLEKDQSLGSLSDDEEAADAREKLLIEANNRLFEGVVDQQIREMRKTSPKFLEMNILQALKEEAGLYKHSDPEVREYMKTKIQDVSDMAVIRGAYNIDTSNNRYINSWGINGFSGFTEEDVKYLFVPAKAQAKDIATCVPNSFYSPYELVRANSVSLLELEKNFKGFTSAESTANSDGHVGSYFKAYQDINRRIVAREPDYSRHLDKRWQLPAYMPNIGAHMKDSFKDILSGLYYGALLEKYAVQENSGDDYWYFVGDNPGYVTDFNGYYISLGGTANLDAGLNELFERGLIDNPSIVEYVKNCTAELWASARKEWQKTERAGKDVLQLMKDHSLIKKMMEGFDYGDIYSSWRGKKWFAFLSASNNNALTHAIELLKTDIFDDLINHVVEVFEPSANTRKLCEALFEAIPNEVMKKAALQQLEKAAKNHKFDLRDLSESVTRDDVSIFFNFTGMVFEKSDPLMGLVNVGEPLLFYDRLSVGSFPIIVGEREEYIDNHIFDMRNLLESRALSRKDRNGRIRLIVAMDLAKGICQTDENKMRRCLPAQNARFFKKKIAEAFTQGTFDEEDRLIDRFKFCFVFVDSSNDKQALPKLYRETAFLGYTDLSDMDWITTNIVDLFHESAKNIVLDLFKTTFPNTRLDDANAKEQFRQLMLKLKDMLKDKALSLMKYLEEVGVLEEFQGEFDRKLQSLETVGDLMAFNFKQEILSIVTSLLGFRSESFLDSTFFLLRVNNSTESEKCKGEIVFKSLVQLIATMCDNDFRSHFMANPALNTPWYFSMDVANAIKPEICFNENAFVDLSLYAKKCKEKLEDLHCSKGSPVSYDHFDANTEDPSAADSHSVLNDKLEEEKDKNRDGFLKVRKIPFFFGKKPGDWSWYDKVVASVEKMYRFEEENDRPLYDVPRRITDSQMKKTQVDSTYSQLEVEMNKLESTPVTKVPMEDLKKYQENRHKTMGEFSKAINHLKAEMVKLGFLSRLLWISIISSLVFTLCFAYHYFYNDFEGEPVLIAVAFGAIALLFLVGSIIARARVKNRIAESYAEIDGINDRLRKLLKDFLQEVYLRVENQNEADIRKRNLDEMKSKLAAFYGQNKQVELWEAFFKGVDEKLDKLTHDFEKDDAVEANPISALRIEEHDFRLSLFPFFPFKVRREFNAMTTQLMGANITPVTCFVNQFDFKRLPR